jgi:hypothetical protein
LSDIAMLRRYLLYGLFWFHIISVGEVVTVIEVVMLLTVRGCDALIVDRPRQDFCGGEVTCFRSVKLNEIYVHLAEAQMLSKLRR